MAAPAAAPAVRAMKWRRVRRTSEFSAQPGPKPLGQPGRTIGRITSMNWDFGERASQLRARLRSLIAENIPEDYLGAFTDDPADLDVAQRFCRTLAEEGLLTVAWPQEYGGAGGSVWEQTVLREEMWAHHEP